MADRIQRSVTYKPFGGTDTESHIIVEPVDGPEAAAYELSVYWSERGVPSIATPEIPRGWDADLLAALAWTLRQAYNAPRLVASRVFTELVP